MTASELYDQLSQKTAALQSKLEACRRTDMALTNDISDNQQRMWRLMEIVIETGGDRELEGPELIDLNL